MNVKSAVGVILIIVFATGCQKAISTPVTPTPVRMNPTPTPTATQTSVPEPATHQPVLISKEKLNCSSLGTFISCLDDVLSIEFEYPETWGDIEAVLRTGGYSGYAYDYYFGGKTMAEAEPLVAGGRSKDFSEGRGGIATDFAGYGKTGMQLKESCDQNLQSLYPICQKSSSYVAWMIRFPNAEYICESAPGFYTTPVFRIEVDLPENPKINGFVFEAPFYSEQFSNEIQTELHPLLGLGSNRVPTQCDEKSRQAFDAKLRIFLEKLSNNTVDNETQQKLNQLIHLATSIMH